MQLNGRKVVDVEVDGIDPRDYPDFCDAYFASAIFEDTLEELSEAELDQLRDDNPDQLWEMASERMH